MNSSKLTPKELALAVNKNSVNRDVVLDFLTLAAARELQEFIHFIDIITNKHWFDRADIALNIRIAEDSAKTAEKMSEQTAILVAESKRLNEQNKILVGESKNLSKLTKWIIWLTWGLLALTAALLIRDLRKETHEIDVINNPITAANPIHSQNALSETTQQYSVWFPSNYQNLAVCQILTNLDSPVIKLDAEPIPGSLAMKAESPTNSSISFKFSHYYVSNNSIVLPKANFNMWHDLLKTTTNVQMRIFINYTKNVRGQQ